MIEHVAVLERIQARAAREPREHLVALVEHAFGLPTEQAERLIPRGVAVGSDTRIDCENPIRDENGKFLGCEPGEGGGGGGGGGGSTGGERPPAGAVASSPGSAPPSAPRASSPRVAELRERLQLSPAEKARIEEETNWYTNPEEREAAEEKELLAVEQRRAGDALAAKVRERGHLKEMPSAKRDEHRAVAAKIQGRVEETAKEWEKESAEIAQIMADVRALDGDDEEIGESPEDLFSSMGEFTGVERGEAESSVELPDFDPDDDPGDFSFDDGDVAEGESEKEAKARQQAAHKERAEEFAANQRAHQEAKAQLPAKVKEARDRLQAVYDRQVALAAELKALDKEETKARRASEKEGEIDSAADLIDTSKFASYDPDEGGPTDPAERAAYDEAYDAANHLIDSDDRGEISASVDPDSLKAATKETASLIKGLTKYLVKGGHEKAAPKKAKTTKKAKAAAEDDDEDEEDGDEE